MNGYMGNNMFGFGNFGGNYNGYCQQNQYQSPQVQTHIIKVNGENGAKSLNLAPNCSALALDENEPIVWFISSDGAGYRTTTPYSITLFKQEPVVDITSLENRVKRLEEIFDEPYLTTADKSSKSTKSNT